MFRLLFIFSNLVISFFEFLVIGITALSIKIFVIDPWYSKISHQINNIKNNIKYKK